MEEITAINIISYKRKPGKFAICERLKGEENITTKKCNFLGFQITQVYSILKPWNFLLFSKYLFIVKTLTVCQDPRLIYKLVHVGDATRII